MDLLGYFTNIVKDCVKGFNGDKAIVNFILDIYRTLLKYIDKSGE